MVPAIPNGTDVWMAVPASPPLRLTIRACLDDHCDSLEKPSPLTVHGSPVQVVDSLSANDSGNDSASERASESANARGTNSDKNNDSDSDSAIDSAIGSASRPRR